MRTKHPTLAKLTQQFTGELDHPDLIGATRQTIGQMAAAGYEALNMLKEDYPRPESCYWHPMTEVDLRYGPAFYGTQPYLRPDKQIGCLELDGTANVYADLPELHRDYADRHIGALLVANLIADGLAAVQNIKIDTANVLPLIDGWHKVRPAGPPNVLVNDNLRFFPPALVKHAAPRTAG